MRWRVRRTVLVVVAVVGERNLPSQATAARLIVSIGRGLRVEHGLGERQPLWLVLGRVRKADFGSQHGAHAPEALIVVAEGHGDVAWHVVAAFADLPKHGLGDNAVVRVVAREVPVIDQGSPHCAGLPPVVITCRRRTGQDARRLACLVAVIVCHQVMSEGLGRTPDCVVRLDTVISCVGCVSRK